MIVESLLCLAGLAFVVAGVVAAWWVTPDAVAWMREEREGAGKGGESEWDGVGVDWVAQRWEAIG